MRSLVGSAVLLHVSIVDEHLDGFWNGFPPQVQSLC